MIGFGGGDVGLFDSLRKKSRPGTVRGATRQDTAHLEEWTARRHGVEAFVEPRTNVTGTTILLVAHDGEWTRRRVDGPDAAFEFAKRRSMPIYEVERVGYPKRMREYQARQKRSGG
jgi:hypothetical protein